MNGGGEEGGGREGGGGNPSFTFPPPPLSFPPPGRSMLFLRTHHPRPPSRILSPPHHFTIKGLVNGARGVVIGFEPNEDFPDWGLLPKVSPMSPYEPL